MRHIIFPLLAALFFCAVESKGQNRGEPVSDSLVLTLTRDAILDIYEDFNLPELFFPIHFELVELHKITYYTLNGRGDSLILASGLLTFPVDTVCAFPLLNYNHGSLLYDEGLSDFKAKMNQHFIGVPFAANGYVAVLPDYLGYGATPLDHPHPYIHARSEASAVVDMLRAAKTLCAANHIQLNGELFLLGYSQGGHVTMATHRELENMHADEFTVTASAPCSGPYDMSGIMYDSIFYSPTYSNPFFIAFGTLSYQYIYQDMYDHISEAFQPPWDTVIPRIFNRYTPESYLLDSLPTPGVQMFQPTYLAEVLSDSLHPLNVAVRDNDLYDWVPRAPVHLYYCTADEQIPYINALFTADYMTGLGANVLAINSGPYDHVDCTPIALVSAKLWFDGLRTSCTIGTEVLADAGEVRFFPNPFLDQFTVSLPGPTSGHLLLTDLLGRPIYESAIGLEHQVSLPVELPPGTYVARVQAGAQTTLAKLVKQ